MYNTINQHDYLQAEVEYRLGRTRADIVGRRARRALARQHSEVDRGDAGDLTRTTAR
jgi:hypothetical protein